MSAGEDHFSRRSLHTGLSSPERIRSAGGGGVMDGMGVGDRILCGREYREEESPWMRKMAGEISVRRLELV